MSDPLADWYQHQVVVERYSGAGAYGDTFDPPETVTGFVSDRTVLVGGPNGTQVASTAAVAFPMSVAYVPVESRVTLPAVFGGRVCTVVSTAVGDGGGQPVPEHQEIAVL